MVNIHFNINFYFKNCSVSIKTSSIYASLLIPFKLISAFYNIHCSNYKSCLQPVNKGVNPYTHGGYGRKLVVVLEAGNFALKIINQNN